MFHCAFMSTTRITQIQSSQKNIVCWLYLSPQADMNNPLTQETCLARQNPSVEQNLIQKNEIQIVRIKGQKNQIEPNCKKSSSLCQLLTNTLN